MHRNAQREEARDKVSLRESLTLHTEVHLHQSDFADSHQDSRQEC